MPVSTCIGLASDDVTKLSNAWQRGKLVLNKESAPYKSMLGEKSLTGRSSLFLPGEIGTNLTTPSRLSASHFKRSRGLDKCGAVFRSIDDLPACFCMGRHLCLEPILPVATPVAGLRRSTCKPYASPKWWPLCMRSKVVSFFVFFQELSNKKKTKKLWP